MGTSETNSNGSLGERQENKLYIGNLDHRVTEYNVIKMFSPFGKILSEEYMWHRHGPKRGEPRGFAFVQFSTKEEAEKAKAAMDGKLAFGRPLVVRFVDEKPAALSASPPVKASSTTAAPSSLSSHIGINAKIIAIRNKLKAMEQDNIQENEESKSKRAKTTG